MSYLRSYKSWIYTVHVYECDECGAELDEQFPMTKDKNKDEHYCIECSFRKGFITEVEFCDMCGYSNSYMFAAGINPYTNEIEIVSGSSKSVRKGSKYKKVRTKRNKFTWEKTESQLRKDWRYKIWREEVLKRDVVCQHCGSDKKLVAHHKKKLSDYPEHAFDVDNGMTLCASCHPKEHAKMRKQGE